MKRTSRLKIARAMSALTFVALSFTGNAHAERMPASIGSARLGSERACLRYDFGRVVNTCNFPVIYNLTPRPRSGVVLYRATGHGGVTCRGISIDAFGDVILRGPSVLLDGTTSVQQLYLHDTDAMIFECTFPASSVPNAWLGTIEF